MSDPLQARLPRWLILPASLVAVAAVTMAVVALREPTPGHTPQSAPPQKPMKVFRFVEPSEVRHRPRFLFTFDPPEALTELRKMEELDGVVSGARSDMEAFRKLTAWARKQFQPGIPDPYPPLDARIILRDIRSGFTGGFCAQYNYVLVQSMQALGYPARYVTVVDHEVVEGWLKDERRWVCLDPLHGATYVDEEGRALSVLELSRRHREGRPPIPGPESRPGTAEEVARAFDRFSVWLRNDHITNPVNFTDIDRYKVDFRWTPSQEVTPGAVWTDLAADLYFDPSSLIEAREKASR